MMKNADMPAMPITNNELAFSINNGHADFGGLTKREMFAMHAMQGLLSDADYADLYESSDEWVKNISEASIEFADALLAELEKNK